MFTLDLAREVLAAQPFSAMLGTRISHLDDETVVLELDVDDRLRQQYGLIHGGVLAYLADNALTYAGALSLGANVVTSGFTIDYVSPARDGAVLRATAHLAHGGRRKALATCDIDIVDAAGTAKRCAVAMGTTLTTN
ncbi:PaaI family thioesterase [Gordonia sp. TBRC 11910]|uniref:Medium/long-chain acyl-CoA thioesterase YigI n=1 Tax=Gordonia asplenii TaxID=2725283 RepID=A0A848L8E9_9ACTN|nr:PaaI family thioesterase [Gordonia asplenii]NMO04751.1 PaaI family thioesterase [Gordonia asplenii]